MNQRNDQVRPLQVVVIGAGVGGLALAAGLRQAGVGVTLVERRPSPEQIEKGGAFILWNNAVEALSRLGLADEVIVGGAVLNQVEWRTPQERTLARWPLEDIQRRLGNPALGVRRSRLQATLRGAVDDDVLELGVGCEGFTTDPEGVTVRLSDGRELRADVLVGADGINSVVRAAMQGGATPPRYAGVVQSFGITRSEIPRPDRATFLEYDGRGLRFFIFPVGGGETYWAAATRAPHRKNVDVRSPADEKDRLQRSFSGWPPVVESLLEATAAEDIFTRDIVDRDPIRAWGAGRVTLLGDAAHPITPNLGQGACQAIEDAVVLARHLALAPADRDPSPLLRGYEARRAPRTNSFVRRSRAIGVVGRWRNPVACHARSGITRVVVAGPAFRRHAADMAYAF